MTPQEERELALLMGTQDDELEMGQVIGSFSDDVTEAIIEANGSVSPDDVGEHYGAQLEYERAEQRAEVESLAGGITGAMDLEIGGATPYIREMNRFLNMSSNVQINAINLSRNPTAFSEIFYQGTEEGEINLESAKQAVTNFGKVIKSNPKDFFNELERRVMREQGVDTLRASTVQADVNMAFQSVSVTAAQYEESGSPMFGESYKTKAEGLARGEAKIEEATYLLNLYGELYIPQELKEAGGPLLEKRRTQVRTALANRLINQQTNAIPMRDKSTGLQATDSKGNPIFESVKVPLSNELDIRGLVPSLSQTGYSGTPYTRTEYSDLFPSFETLGTEENLNLTAFKESAAGKLGYKTLRRQAPSARRSFFRPSKALTNPESKALYGQMVSDFGDIADTLRQYGVTHVDERYGNIKRAPHQLDAVKGETDERDFMESINQGMLLGLSSDPMDTGQTQDYLTALRGGVGKGTDRGGQYGDKGLSEIDVFRMALEEGLSEEEAYFMLRNEKSVVKHTLTGTKEVEIPSGVMHQTGPSNIQAYDHHGVKLLNQMEPLQGIPLATKITQNIYSTDVTGSFEEEGQFRGPVQRDNTDLDVFLTNQSKRDDPKQGSEAWKAQREGKVTASLVGKLLRDDLKGGGAAGLAERMITGKDLDDNFYLKRGREGEEFVKKSFEDTVGMHVEEAFFEENDELEGFGVSPDGYVFDEAGDAQGIAEFKYVSSNKKLQESYDQYYNQAQLQMAITGQEEVHFFRVNANTEEYLYDVIKADKSTQGELISRGKEALLLKEKVEGGDMAVLQQYKMSKKQQIDKEKSKATAYRPVKGEQDVPMTAYGASYSEASSKSGAQSATYLNALEGATEALESIADTMGDLDDIEMMGRGGQTFQARQSTQAKQQNNIFNKMLKSLNGLSEKFNDLGDSADGTGGSLTSLASKAAGAGMLLAKAGMKGYDLAAKGTETMYSDLKAGRMLGLDAGEYESFAANAARDLGVTRQEVNTLLGEASEGAFAGRNPLSAFAGYEREIKEVSMPGVLQGMKVFSPARRMELAKEGPAAYFKAVQEELMPQLGGDAFKIQAFSRVIGMPTMASIAPEAVNTTDSLFKPTRLIDADATIAASSTVQSVREKFRTAGGKAGVTAMNVMAPAVDLVGDTALGAAGVFERSVDAFADAVNSFTANEAGEGEDPYRNFKNSPEEIQKNRLKHYADLRAEKVLGSIVPSTTGGLPVIPMSSMSDIRMLPAGVYGADQTQDGKLDMQITVSKDGSISYDAILEQGAHMQKVSGTDEQ